MHDPPLTSRSVPSELSLIVAIEDHGVGVPEELRESIFQPFRQAQRHTGGTGLGLYSLFKRMEALGGDCGVRARSDGQAGSVFWFSFPYRPDTTVLSYKSAKLVRRFESSNCSEEDLRHPSPTRGTATSAATSLSFRASGAVTSKRPPHVLTTTHTEQQTPVPGLSPARSSSLVPPSDNALQVLPALAAALGDNASAKQAGLRILVTDDAPTILKVCRRMLTINGHTVDTAVNGNESLEKLKIKYTNQEYDALVTDIQMPVMDGIECTKRFRVWEEAQQCHLDAQGLPRRPRFLIVGISANCDAQTKQDSLEAGMDSFCPKPFKYEDFEAVIATHAHLFDIVPNDEVIRKDSKEYLCSSCL